MYCALFVIYCVLLYVLCDDFHDCYVCLCLVVVFRMMRRASCFVVFVCLCVVYTSVFVCVDCDVLCAVV